MEDGVRQGQGCAAAGRPPRGGSWLPVLLHLCPEPCACPAVPCSPSTQRGRKLGSTWCRLPVGLGQSGHHARLSFPIC